MYQKLKFIKTSTAGNKTLFLYDIPDLNTGQKYLKTIFRKDNILAEQYGFLKFDREGYTMSMAGDELSGGGLLASFMVFETDAGRTQINNRNITVNGIITSRDKNTLRIQAPLPKDTIIQPAVKTKLITPQGAISGYKVILDGIAYFVTKEKIDLTDPAKILKLIDKQMGFEAIPAIGLITIPKQGEIKPLILVKTLNTITFEQGCTTGTISAQLSFKQKDGLWKQPSGQYIKALIDNSIELEAPVELLTSGTIYLNSENTL